MYKKEEVDPVKAKTAQKLITILVLVGVAVILCGAANETLFVVGSVIASSCFIPHFLFNKCPRCGKNLGRNQGEFCQHCGSPIE